MPSTIAFTNLANGQEITVPYEVDGTITTTGGNLIAVARQIRQLVPKSKILFLTPEGDFFLSAILKGMHQSGFLMSPGTTPALTSLS